MAKDGKKAQIAQVFLLLLLLSMPLFYFIQKYEYIHNDLYTVHMQGISQQIGERLERETIWQDSKDLGQSSMMYTAYYYPQALSVVCHTTPVTYVRDQNTPPGAAYLVSNLGTLYPASLVWDGEYDTTLLVFENIPSDFINHLSYLDIVPEQKIPADGIYNPSELITDRIRYALKG